MCLALVLGAAQAATTSWKGTSSTAWATAANWTAGVPNATVDAIIGDVSYTGSFVPEITKAASCKSLTLGTNTTPPRSLTITRGGITVSGNITIGTSGTLPHSFSKAISLTGNWTNSGTYTYSGNKACPEWCQTMFVEFEG